MSTGTLTSSSGLSRDHLSINCPAMSSIRGMYSRIACWLKGAIRMLCARCHIGSDVSLVNRPPPATLFCRAFRPAPIFLSKVVSSHISSTRSAPDTITLEPAGKVNL